MSIGALFMMTAGGGPIPEPPSPVTPKPEEKKVMLRAGDWVMAKGKIAVFQSMLDQSTALVHLVDPKTGETIRDRNGSPDCAVDASALSHPKAADLPQSRVAHLTPERLKSLGYE